MRILDMPFVREFVRVCDDGWNLGWHECNGGNLSYLLRDREVKEIRHALNPKGWHSVPGGIEVNDIAGSHVLITAAGAHFRDMTERPKRCCGIIELSKNGREYRKCWGFADGGRPTSELPSHLLALDVNAHATGKRHRVVYHCHPANLIALTFVLPLDGDNLTRHLTEMISECKLVFPDGLGMLGWMEPGSTELGIASIESLAHHDAVVWSHHGLFCTAPSFEGAFGLTHTIEKASKILVKVLAMQGDR